MANDQHTNPLFPSLNYFTCTLGLAAQHSLCNLTSLPNINTFIDHQASTFPSQYAVAFPVPIPAKDGGGGEWGYEVLTFRELRNRSVARAGVLKRELEAQDVRGKAVGEGRCVALLCPSSMEFVVTWLGLMRCGFAVLLIAPQLQAEAIAGLCGACDASILLYHASYHDLASRAASASTTGLKSVQFFWPPTTTSAHEDEAAYHHALSLLASSPQPSPSSTAFIFHTSGTSTGLPSPIPHPHHAAFSLLPVFPGSHAATFSTTPLYHGGIADSFRAWTSAALIWLFPGADVPITALNILRCLEAADRARGEGGVARVGYFSCVPYVLQLLAAEEAGMEMLRNMQIVGVGGAALGREVGVGLVGEGVNLISRFGSAECGFLLSSDREFEVDREWEYLRLPPESNSDMLIFEPVDGEDGLAELVVLPSWPLLTKTNRPDGSFATSDLFKEHEVIKGAWKYVGRRDGQITLTTGKKFDPVPLEEEIASRARRVREVLVVGAGRQGAGVFVFWEGEEDEDKGKEREEEVWRVVEDMGRNGPSHARVFREYVVFLEGKKPMPRSSKGTIMRRVAEKMYATEIEALYSRASSTVNTAMKGKRDMSYGEAKTLVREALAQVLREDQKLEDTDDFYMHGVDSLMCTRIRATLQRNISGSEMDEEALPWNVVYDCGNIHRLAAFIASGSNAQNDAGIEAEMRTLVEEFSTFDIPPSPSSTQAPLNSPPTGHTVLLTGATGALGTHILSTLLSLSGITTIICLVRGTSSADAHARILATLTARDLPPLDPSQNRVIAYAWDVGAPMLGLGKEVWGDLGRKVTCVVHAAWDVNFSLPLRSFIPHFRGLQSLLQLASHASTSSPSRNPVIFSFCSSVASVSSTPTTSEISEDISKNPADASPTGYGRAKWVAEGICNAFTTATSTTSSTKPKVEVKILRLGQLTGDTVTGRWNVMEAWPRMLSTVEVLDCLPRVEMGLDWLPLDVTAKAVLELSFATGERGSPDKDNGDGVGEGCEVYHMVNYRDEATWVDLLGWIAAARVREFEIVDPQEWLEGLKGLDGEHPAKALLGLWRGMFAGDGEAQGKEGRPRFAVERARGGSRAMREVEPVGEELGRRIWRWLEGRT